MSSRGGKREGERKTKNVFSLDRRVGRRWKSRQRDATSLAGVASFLLRSLLLAEKSFDEFVMVVASSVRHTVRAPGAPSPPLVTGIDQPPPLTIESRLFFSLLSPPSLPRLLALFSLSQERGENRRHASQLDLAPSKRSRRLIEGGYALLLTNARSFFTLSFAPRRRPLSLTSSFLSLSSQQNYQTSLRPRPRRSASSPRPSSSRSASRTTTRRRTSVSPAP